MNDREQLDRQIAIVEGEISKARHYIEVYALDLAEARGRHQALLRLQRPFQQGTVLNESGAE